MIAIQNNSTLKVSLPKETSGIEKKAEALLSLEEDPELCKLDKTNLDVVGFVKHSQG